MTEMKITAVETVRLGEHPNSLFVRLHTDAGLVGLGDTWRTSDTVNTFVHKVAAPLLLGQDPLAIERHWRTLYRSSATSGLHSSEMRGLSAIDVALWDLVGQAQGLPVYRLLGGPTQDRVRIYNTCAGYRYGGRQARGAWTPPTPTAAPRGRTRTWTPGRRTPGALAQLAPGRGRSRR